MSTTITHYPVVNYNPEQYVPLDYFQKQWAEMKTNAANRVDDPFERNPYASRLTVRFYEFVPFLLLFCLSIITLSAMGVRASDPNAPILSYLLVSPFAFLFYIGFTVCLVHIFRRNRFAIQLKNAADFAVMESARRYLRKRYGFLPKNWDHNFVSFLVGEDVKDNRFSSEYQLTVRNFNGQAVLMVCNIDGEAPVNH